MPAALIRKFEKTPAPPLSSPFAGENFGAIAPLLDLALVETHAQGAYLYCFDRAMSLARMVVWSGLSPIAAAIPLEVPFSDMLPHSVRTTPVVLQGGACRHQGFATLPEFRKNRFEGVVSVPLLEAGEVFGLLNVCRSREAALQPREFSFLLSLSVPVGALLAASVARLHLEREVEKLNQQLADRKLLDRAKGLIQSRFECSEEQAYYCLRNLSRRKRTPMRLIAQQIVESGAAGVLEDEECHEA